MASYKEYFAGKRVTVMGLGLLGRGVGDIRFLAECGAQLTVTDLKSEAELAPSLEHLKNIPGITFHLGGHRLEDFSNRDLILKAAGVPLESPFIAEARKHNIPVRMSADLFAELSAVPVVGVTGTRGKSTITHLIADILEADGRHVLRGGNVRGVSTLALLPEVTPNTIAVLELDSWQLQGFGDARISPQIAVFATFLPDHLNYYKNDPSAPLRTAMRAYFADKANIFLHQTESDFLVLGEQVAPFVKEYGYQQKIRSHVSLAGADTLPKEWALRIPGEHNRYNAGLATEAARSLGVDEKIIRQAIESFKGVPGRLELLGEIGGVQVYNDNNATTPDATTAALSALDPEKKGNVTLIMGGADKGLDMSAMRAAIHAHCAHVFLLAGTGTERIRPDAPEVPVFDSLAPALEAALAATRAGDIVLFSPAFASFGMFKNEYDRNDQFVAAVKQYE